jgi:hypothetical protein
MRLHNDEPTLLDQLERREMVRRIGDDVAGCDPPHVFGIHGDWGLGKTSFLHQLQFYLTGACPQHSEGGRDLARKGNLFLDGDGDQKKQRRETLKEWEKRISVVWFEAWRYQHDQAPIVALLQEIRAQLPWTSKAFQEAMKLGEIAVRSALLSFEDLTKKIGVQASRIQEAGEKWEKDHLATVLPSHMIRQHLEKAIRTLLGGDATDVRARRLVILVDDLDRCDAEAAYKLLEGIKIYLSLPNCVFVLGMNQKIIEGAIARHLPDEKDENLRIFRAREYLEKICHSVEHLPGVRNPADLLRGYLEDLDHSAVVCAVIKDFECLPANPRRIKAYANLLRRYVPRFKGRFADPNLQADTAKLVVIFSCLYQFHPDVYRILEKQPRFYQQIRQFSLPDGPAVEHPVLRRLILSEKAILSAASATLATPAGEPVDAFPDPAEGNVLRVQKLIRTFRPATTTEVVDFLVN